MGMLETNGKYETSIKGYGQIVIGYRLPSAIEADKIHTDAGGEWNKEALFRALVTDISVEKEPELNDVDAFLNAPKTVKAYWGVIQAILSDMWLDDDSKN